MRGTSAEARTGVEVWSEVRKCHFSLYFNPLTPTFGIWLQQLSYICIQCQTGLSRRLKFLTSGHSDAIINVTASMSGGGGLCQPLGVGN